MPNIYDIPTQLVDVVDPAGNILVDPNIPDAVTPLDVDLLRFKPELPPLDYTNLDFSSIKLQLINLLRANSAKLGYSVRDFADSNSAGMFMNLIAHTGQLLSYHMDSVVNELFLDTSQSTYSAYRLLNMFRYKPARPKQGVIMLKLKRRRSTASTQQLRDLEDSSEIIFSSSTERRRLTFGGETFEVFPAKVSNGVFEPDYLGDLTLPAFKSLGYDDPDADVLEEDLNTYTCFALSGVTRIEDFRSNGKAGQVVYLKSGQVLDSKIIVQVQDTNVKIPGKYAYETWGELSYLALAGFKSATEVGATKNLNTPYLIAPFKLSDEAYALKKNSALPVGMLLEINYNQEADIAKYTDFVTLNVPYRVGIVSNLSSEVVPDDRYVDLLLYHPSYIYGREADNDYTGLVNQLPTSVVDYYGNDVAWSPGDILYLLELKTLTVDNKVIKQPQIISDTQLHLADYTKYPDVKFLKDNPQYRLAVGKVLSDNTIAFGLSADVDTYYQAESVYEVTWDGDFKAAIRFGDNRFGKIPNAGAAIRVIYRVNDTNSYGYIVKSGEASQIVKVKNTAVEVSNEYSSSPSIRGESIDTAKELATRFFAAQDRAVSGDDYLTLAKRYNASYKIAASLVKSDADGSVVRLFCLSTQDETSVQPLTVTEKFQLRNYLNQYKCIGTDIEVVDGLVRKIDLRIDAKLKAGYLSGQVKNELVSTAKEFFKLSNIEMGMGFDAAGFIKMISNVSGVKSLDLYMGGIASAFLNDGTELAAGIKTYKQLKSIPSYKDAMNEFPKVATEYDVLFGLEDPVKPYEILVLDTITVNALT